MEISLPPELQSIIGNERVDFATKAKRKQPRKKSMVIILIGLVWSGITSIFILALFGPLIRSGQVTIKIDDVPTTATWDNFEPILVPAILIGLFTLVGLVFILVGIFSLLSKGGYFVGTANRLILFRKGTINSYDWEQFSGKMEINLNRGDMTMELRSGTMMRRKNGPDYFVPDNIYISGVPNVLEIESVCRKRIKENDPTPKTESIY